MINHEDTNGKSTIQASFPKMVRLLAISSLAIFFKKFSNFGDFYEKYKIPVEKWDFLLTAAGCGLALEDVEMYPAEHDSIRSALNEVNEALPSVIENFTGFMSNAPEGDPVTHHIGVWVMWNLKGSMPEHEEIEQVAPAIGSYVVNMVSKARQAKN